MQKRRWLWIVLVAAAVAAVYYAQGGPGEAQELTVGLTPWSSTVPSAQIAKLLLEERGYRVRFEEADVGVVFAGLARGDVDIFTDAWLPTLHASYMERYGDQVETIGTVYRDAPLGWVVPDYVPINSVAELADHVEEFDIDHDGKGEIVGIDPGAGMMQVSPRILEAYDLTGSFELVEGSEFAMLTELSRAIADERWICVLGWSPHWMFAEYDLKYLEEPRGFWKGDDARILVRRGLAQDAPEAVALLREMQISISEMEQMILENEVRDQDPEETARRWIEAHREEVNRWGR